MSAEPNTDTRAPLVTIMQFASCDFEGPLAGNTSADALSFMLPYQQAAHEAKSAGRESDAQVFMLLHAICSIHFTPENRGRPWGPMFEMGNQRSMLPSDVRGPQSDVLESLLPAVENPVLRARLADVVWSNDKRRAGAAQVAVNAYVECAGGLSTGALKPEYGPAGMANFDSLKAVQRAVQIAYAVTKKGDALPAAVAQQVRALYDAAMAEKAYVIFQRVASTALYYELIGEVEIADNAEALARSAAGEYPMAVKGLWDMAAQLYQRLGNAEAQRRCQLGSVDQLLLMRDECGQAGAKASWVMDALQALRHIKGVEELEAKLEEELRRLQRASIKEMGGIPFELDVGEERAAALELFDGATLADSLKTFALLESSPVVAHLREGARKSIEMSPLVSMMSVNHVDEEGKTIRKSPGAGGHEEPSDDWYLQTIQKAEAVRRLQVVSARIEPARVLLGEQFTFEERHFGAIVAYARFVPPSQRHLLTLGFARFFQGDHMSASYIVLPQLEPCLRHILRLAGHDPAKRFEDATEEDLDLGGMLTRLRPELEAILTVDLTAEIERLFHLRPGPALRHDVAHGLLSAGQCFGPDAVYAVWLMYRICCLFVMPDWDKFVVPALAAEEPGR